MELSDLHVLLTEIQGNIKTLEAKVDGFSRNNDIVFENQKSIIDKNTHDISEAFVFIHKLERDITKVSVVTSMASAIFTAILVFVITKYIGN
jgi:hypothetical protein